MQEREVHIPASRTGRDGFQPCIPKAAERASIYQYAVSMDGIRYRVTLKSPLNKSSPQAHLLNMKEGDFSGVSRDGRPVPVAMFVSVYSRFSHLAEAELHTIEIYISVASL